MKKAGVHSPPFFMRQGPDTTIFTINNISKNEIPERTNKVLSTVSIPGPTVQRFNLKAGTFPASISNSHLLFLHTVSYTNNCCYYTLIGVIREKNNFMTNLYYKYKIRNGEKDEIRKK